MVYVNCFFYAFDIPEEELKKYNFPNSQNLIIKSKKYNFKDFNKALDIHNLTVINRFLGKKLASISEFKKVKSLLSNNNNYEEEEKFETNHSKFPIKNTMKSYKSVSNLSTLTILEEDDNSSNLSYLLNKTSELVINGIKQISEIKPFPEILDYYNYTNYD